MVCDIRNEVERALSSSSQQHPTASTRKRRLEVASQPLDVSKAIDPSILEPYASLSAISPKYHAND